MQFVLFICLVIVASVSARFHADCDSHFGKFMKKHFVRYASQDEQHKRRGIFCENMKEADRLNDLNGSPAFGVSKFSDRTHEEFSVLLGRKVCTSYFSLTTKTKVHTRVYFISRKQILTLFGSNLLLLSYRTKPPLLHLSAQFARPRPRA